MDNEQISSDRFEAWMKDKALLFSDAEGLQNEKGLCRLAWQEQEKTISELREEIAKFNLKNEAWRTDKIDEAMLRRQDGYIHVGHGCEIAIKGTTEDLYKSKEEIKKFAKQAIAIAVMDLGYEKEPVYGHDPLRHQCLWSTAAEKLTSEELQDWVKRRQDQMKEDSVPVSFKEEPLKCSIEKPDHEIKLDKMWCAACGTWADHTSGACLELENKCGKALVEIIKNIPPEGENLTLSNSPVISRRSPRFTWGSDVLNGVTIIDQDDHDREYYFSDPTSICDLLNELNEERFDNAHHKPSSQKV